MSRILVVEDSPAEQLLIRSILCQRWPDIEIDACEDVPAALAAIARERPDLILTDYHLKAQSGLDLLNELTQDDSSVPAIVFTSVGSGEVAREVISAGAAGYLSKSHLQTELPATVERLMRTSQRRSATRRLLSSCLHQDLRFSIQNDLELVTPFVDHVRSHLSLATEFGRHATAQITVAIHESLTNAINHGNLELDSELRQEDESCYYQLGERRKGEHPYRDRRVYIALTMSESEIAVRIRDEGPGFDVESMLRKAEEYSPERIGGRGLLMIRAFMDTLSFNDQGNEIRFSKRIEVGRE